MLTKSSISEKYQEHIGLVTKALLPLVTENRIQTMQKNLQKRSRKVCVVFENTHHSHNISAVLRTMDAFGFLDVFFIYNNPHIRFRANDSIDRNSSKWLIIRAFDEVKTCAEKLKADGYKIVLISRPDFSRTAQFYNDNLSLFSTSHLSDTKFLEMAHDQNLALVFGTELYGISEYWTQFADCYLSVDMYGFCESLNVSVCAGIVLSNLRETLTKYNLLSLLSHFEQTLIFEHWISKDTKHAYKYISNKYPELLEWFLQVRSSQILYN